MSLFDEVEKQREKRSNRFSDDLTKYSEGDIGAGSVALRGAGEAAGMAGDMVGTAMSNTMILGDLLELAGPLVAKGLNQLWSGVKDTGAVKIAEKWLEDNPEKARNAAMLYNMTELAGGAGVLKAGHKMVDYGVDAQKGGMVGSASNFIDGNYGVKEGVKPPLGTDTLTKVLGPTAEKLNQLKPHPKLEGVANAPDHAASQLAGRAAWGLKSIKDAASHVLSPTSRATYGQHGIQKPAQKHIQGHLDNMADKSDTMAMQKAVAQGQYSGGHIPQQAGRVGDMAKPVDDIMQRSFMEDYIDYEPGKLSESLQKYSYKVDKDVAKRGGTLPPKSPEWRNKPDEQLAKKDADFVERWVGQQKDFKGMDKLAIKAPTSIETGGHWHDLINYNPVNRALTSIIDKRGGQAFNNSKELFEALENVPAKQRVTGKAGKNTWRVVNRDAKHAEKNGVWVAGTKIGSSVTEGGVSFLTKIDPDGTLTSFMIDKHDFMERVPVLGPAMNRGILPNQLVAVTPPMKGNIYNISKKLRDNYESPKHFHQVRPRASQGTKEILQDIANLEPSKNNLRGEQLKQTGYGLLGMGVFNESENR